MLKKISLRGWVWHDVVKGEKVTDSDFAQKRGLPNGRDLNINEELFYYRNICERFGELDDLSWMGRTKGAPTA